MVVCLYDYCYVHIFCSDMIQLHEPMYVHCIYKIQLEIQLLLLLLLVVVVVAVAVAVAAAAVVVAADSYTKIHTLKAIG